jgi:hypothetical protein
MPGWLVGRLAMKYRALGRYDDEVQLLERYEATQHSESMRTRYLARLSKARAMAAMRKRHTRSDGATSSVRQLLHRGRVQPADETADTAVSRTADAP